MAHRAAIAELAKEGSGEPWKLPLTICAVKTMWKVVVEGVGAMPQVTGSRAALPAPAEAAQALLTGLMEAATVVAAR